MFAKTGILALYRRIFSPLRCANVLILSGMVFTALFYITILIVVAVGCTPQPGDYAMGGWLSPVYHQRCYHYNHGTTAASGVVGAVIDIYILILPLFLVWELRTSTKRKTGLAAIFIVGSSYVVAILLPSLPLTNPALFSNSHLSLAEHVYSPLLVLTIA